MFTGIIEATAKILEHGAKDLRGSRSKTSEVFRLHLERPAIFDDIHIGSSICVSGVCLTVVALDAHSMQFDLSKETLAKTTFGMKKPGDSVNLERAMRADARFEGHIVQGHVDAVGRVISSLPLTVDISDQLSQFVVPKGSITIDGVSLTVATIEKNLVTVALIPHTLENTTLGALKKGDSVNVETDILAKYACRFPSPLAGEG